MKRQNRHALTLTTALAATLTLIPAMMNNPAHADSPTFVPTASAAAPRVAIWNAPRLAAFNAPTQVSPRNLAANLKAAGIAVDLLEVDALADPARFDARRYAAVILPYGNLYPRAAFANLRTFHAAGGSLVTDGVPFSHSGVVRDDGSWDNQGHQDAPALFGSRGIGMGGFRGGPSGHVRVADGDPLGLKKSSITWGEGEANQTIDPASLPAGDTLTPILTADGGEPVAAIIAHKGDGFDGAIDVWANAPVSGDETLAAFATEQIMTRGTVVALTRKGLLDAARQKVALAALDKIPVPRAIMVARLPTPPRPYPTLQPKMPAPAARLYVVDARNHRFNHDEEMLLGSLQGIVNRTQPRIYVLWHDDDQFWLDDMRKRGQTGEPMAVGNDPLASLVQTFRSSIKGAVVADPNVYVSPCVAVDYAGLEDLAITTPEMAARLNLPIKQDLRGRFKNNADAYHFVRTTLLPRMNQYLSLCADPPILGQQLDDLIAARGMAFWVTGPSAQYHPGADMIAELREIEQTFAALPLSAVVRGYWWHGDGNGLDETPGVSLASRFGKITTVSDYVGNFSVTSGIHLPSIKQKPQPPTPKLDRSKVYLAITVTDGDNLCTWRGYFRQFFTDPLAGQFPVAYGMAPTLIDVAPNQLQWYYDHAPANTEFLCDVSGVGYTNPAAWCASVGARDEGFHAFYDWTNRYMERTDLHTIRINLPTTTEIARAAADLPHVQFLMPDYQYQGETPYNSITYALPGGVPVFRGITNASARDMARQIRTRVGATRPAFTNAVVVNWGLKLADLKAMLDELGPEYVAVTPSQLNALYREVHGTSGADGPVVTPVHK